jgi:hypothetical protein
VVVRDVHLGSHETLKREQIMSIEKVLYTAHATATGGRVCGVLGWDTGREARETTRAGPRGRPGHEP